MSNLLKDASILLTPTAYENGRMNAIKPYKDLYGPELVTNGDFATDSDWTKGIGWSISSGTANANSASSSYFYQNINELGVGKTYKVTYTITSYTSGSVVTGIGDLLGNRGVIRNAIGTYTDTITFVNNTANSYFGFFATSSFTGSIDNVSVVEDLSGDFQFSRNSAATRVNAQGLVENVQIISPELVSNGNFSQIGTEEVSNGNFSQEGSELVTNGDFSNGTTDWTPNASATLSIDTGRLKIAISGEASGYAKQDIFTIESGKQYKCTGTVDFGTASQMRFYVSNTGQFFDITQSGNFNFTFTSTGTSTQIRLYTYGDGNYGFWDNISVKEVGQDWSLGTGWSIGDDKAVATDVNNAFLEQSNILTIGKSYKITYTILDYVSGNVRFRANLVNGTTNGGNGTYTDYIVSAGTKFALQGLNSFNGSITNISVKEVGQDWSLGSGWSMGDGIVEANNTSSFISQSGLIEASKLYRLTFEARLKSGTNGTINAYIGGSNNKQFTIANTDWQSFTYENTRGGSSADSIYFNNNGTELELDNISVKEITDDTDLPRINYEGFSYQDSLGSEEVVNGDFSNGSANWTTENTWTIENGVANGNGANGSTEELVQVNVNTTGKTYKATFEVLNYVSGSVGFWKGSGIALTQRNANGTYTEYFTATSDQIRFRGINFIGSIDNVSVKEYLGQEVVPDSGCGSWLLEPQSTNLITYSEDFSSGSWVKTDCSVVSNFGVSPSGQNNASKFTFTTTNTSARAQYNLGSLTTGNTYTQSYYIKSLGADITLRIGTSASAVGEFTDIIATSEWQRFEFTGIASATTEFPRVQNITGALGVEILVWGAQLEQQSYATSYIPTNGATNTRLQDIATNSGNSTLINSTEGVLYADIAALANDGGLRLLQLSDGTNTNRVSLYYDTAINTIYSNVVVNGVSNPLSSSVDILNFTKVAVTWKQNDFGLWINGLKVGTDTSGLSFPNNTLNDLSFSLNGLYNFYGKNKALAVYKEALTDANLRCLTYPNPVATTFDLDFDTIAEQFTFTRGSEATFVNAQGLIESTNQIGPELVTNGDFATDSDWSKVNATISDGKGNLDSTSSTSILFQQNVLTVGKTYKANFDVSNYNGLGTCALINSSGGTQFEITSNGNKDFYFTQGGSSANLSFRAVASGVFSIDNVSVKEVTTATNTPRIDYSTGEKAFLLEPQSTNLVPYSEDFSDSSWTQNLEISIVSDSGISPSGILNAQKVIPTTNNTRHGVGRTTQAIVGHTYSVFAKADGYDWILLTSHISSAPAGRGTFFDVKNGVVGTIGTASQNATIEDVGNGWYRCSIDEGSSPSSIFTVIVAEQDNVDTFVGDGSKGVLVWGAQREALPYATSYIPTSVATATRNQELCNNATPVINSEEGTLYAEFQGLSSSVGNKVISLNDGTNTNAFWLYIISSSNGIRIYDGATIGTYFSVNAFENNKFALVYNSTNTRLFINGSLAITIPFKSMSNLNKISFSDGNEGQKFEGNIKGLKYYPKALADVQLEDLTTI